jgi:cytochrome c oxidase subunit 2
MAFLVVADPPAAFARWRSHEMAAETPPDTAAEEGGERNFIARCGACHSVRGSGAGGRLGPDLTHLASRNTLAAGILKNTRANLEHWIERAQEVKPGSKMPDIDLGPAELKRIADYLETLG